MQGSILTVSVGSAIIAAIAEFADWRRRHRRDIDKVGFMPWRSIALVSIAVAFVSAALALRP